MDLVVKVIGKDIVTEKGSFTSYSLLTSKGNWYRTAKADVKQLEQVKGEIVTVQISRKFDKKVETQHGEASFPTLVIEGIRKPTKEELETYETELAELNAQTLEGVE